MIHIWRPWKLFNFQDPPPPLSICVQASSTPLTLEVKFQTNPPLQMITSQLTLSWRRPLSYRNQSIDLLCKSVDWFLYDNGPRHKRVKRKHNPRMTIICYQVLSLGWLFSTETVVRRCSVKKIFLEISQNFALNFAKFLRTPFLRNTSGRLLL